MFKTLFGKECKQIAKSIVYYLYILILALFLSTQLTDADWTTDMEKPKAGQTSYGIKDSDNKKDIMSATLANLVREVESESFATYPLMFYKEVTLTEEELDMLKEILKDCTGKTWDELMKEEEAYYETFDENDIESSETAFFSYMVEPEEGLTYKEFKKEMSRVAEIIGKGSAYDEENLETGVCVPKTYEDAVKDYEDFCKVDKITGAYMRLYCDYAGLMMAILPMFLGVTRCLRDKRADVDSVIYAKEVSSGVVIASRYLANVCMAFIPVVVIGFFLQLPFCYHANTLGVTPDYLAFLTYPIIWLLPEIMIVMALAFFLTELTDKIIGVFVQIFWMLADEFSTDILVGDFGMKLGVRWNTLGETSSYLAQKQALYFNRGVYTIIAVVFVIVTVFIYEKKRREGESIYAKVFKNRH
ncbi:MAG: ABC transporter permease [Lachnospiraceae bacterium]